jgi:hypothetical protein
LSSVRETAYHAAKLEHHATVMEAAPEPGGMAAHFDFGPLQPGEGPPPAGISMTPQHDFASALSYWYLAPPLGDNCHRETIMVATIVAPKGFASPRCRIERELNGISRRDRAPTIPRSAPSIERR